ncbi:MAG: transcriptional repressor [Anaerotruncus sp.]|jgi:Fe2+ or Zn2+ uptake regulation protein|nr:transcriptional repressor [Anaerotruncus sp.]
MKYSRQRELVRNVVTQNLIHPTADIVYSLVRNEDSNISLGTVYRNLNLLVEQGVLHKISMPGSSDRFDGRTEPHHHLVCTCCGRVFDIEADHLPQLDAQINQLADFAITGYQLLIQGVCRDCQHIETEEKGDTQR